MSCVAFILLAKQASRISGFLRLSGLRDIARILLRFGQIDRDVDRTIFSVSHPFLIFCDTVFPDIVRRLTKLVIIIGCFLRAFRITLREFCPYHTWRWRNTAHNLRIEQILCCYGIFFHDAIFMRICHHVL